MPTRGILDDGRFDFTTRVPLWVFRANRPRAGKDYCAVMTILLYEGIAAEDSPINHRQSEETGKRIMSAARNGRRFMHFSNCSGMLDDIHLTQAITNERITARQLGSNEATSDLSVPNTMEFSIRALRAWAVPYVVPVPSAARVFDQDGAVSDPGVELQLRTLGSEVVRVAELFATHDSPEHEAECDRAAERVVSAAV